MPAEERKRRMARLQRNVLAEDVHGWVDDFLEHARDA
jgi:trehalose-6-phosphate synthase